jgi:diacylglycerol kinase family enzyme
MRLLLLHNEGAGPGSVSGESLQHDFASAGLEVIYRSDDSVRESDLRGVDALVAAGGDGTVAGAVRRFRHAVGRFGIVPLGTANNIATSLGIVGDAATIARGLRGAAERALDVGLCVLGEEAWEFLEGVGVGPIAAAMASAETEDLPAKAMRQRSVDLLPEFCGRARAGGWRVRVDEVALPDDLLLVEVVSCQRIGPGLLPAPPNRTDDGRFEVAYLRAAGQAGFVEAVSRDPLPSPLPLEVARGRSVTMELADTVLRIDDVFRTLQGGGHRLRLSFAGDPVRILVPRGG